MRQVPASCVSLFPGYSTRWAAKEIGYALSDMDMSSATSIYNYMRPIMQDLTIEEAHVMLLNQNFKLIKEFRVSQGGLTEVRVDVRMIIKEAVLNNASVLAFVHNHPSGNIHPSSFDDKLTQTIKKACDLMRIHFLDHVIVCDGDYYSYRERGRL